MRIFSLSLILRYLDHRVILLMHTCGDLVVIENREIEIDIHISALGIRI